MSEKQRAVRVEDEGHVETLFGFEISAGPETYRLLVTHPIAKEGRIAEIPREKIKSIEPAEPGPRRQHPQIIEE